MLEVPSLEERKEDIPDIIAAILPKVCRDSRRQVSYQDLPEDLIAFLSENIQRGNVRGIDRVLSRVISYAERTKRPSDPQKLENHRWDRPRNQGSTEKREALTLDDFMNLPFDVVNDRFPGLTAFMDFVSQVVLEAQRKFGKTGKVARALKITDGAASVRLNRLKAAGARLPNMKSTELTQARTRPHAQLESQSTPRRRSAGMNSTQVAVSQRSLYIEIKRH